MNELKTTKILKHLAFTLAEVLITLGIIGIVAALTIPNLIASYQKKQTVVKLKKVYAVLNQIARSSSDEYGDAATFLTANSTVNEKTTQEFFERYWFPYLNSPTIIKNSSHFYDLKGVDLGFSVATSYAAGRAYLMTMDGICYFVMIMQWVKDNNNNNNQIAVYSTSQTVYVNLNGTKPPNTLGKDIFTFKINFDDNNALPMCSTYTKSQISYNCSKSGGNNAGSCCAEKIKRDGWTIAPDYPWK